jgi:hypothetical protein
MQKNVDRKARSDSRNHIDNLEQAELSGQKTNTSKPVEDKNGKNISQLEKQLDR